MMMTITVGFTLGAAVAGSISAWMIPAFGWRSVFYFGGVVPFIIGIAMFFWLPESLQFLVLNSRKVEKVGETMKQIDPAVPAGSGVEYTVHEENKGGVPLRHLFAEGRARVTILLWVLNFMNIFTLFSLSNWLPTLLGDAGHPANTAVLIGAVLQVGGTAGAFGLAWLIARQGFVRVLTISFTVACVSIALIGRSGLSLPALGAFVFVAGWCIIGGQPGLNALSGTYYPTYLR
jgi:AAHS family 4-hydroxybenzoate transporter-like MFS transporter